MTPTGAHAAPSPCDLYFASDSLVEWTCLRIGEDESLESLYGDRWIDVARFNRIDRRHVVPGTRIRAPKHLQAIRAFSPLPASFTPAESLPQLVLVDLSEQFLGAYEYGRLVLSAPIASGRDGHPTPTGMFRITAYDPIHFSSLYDIADTDQPYPMHHALRFRVTTSGTSYWIHGRDMPGYPASHGCIGLYDEAMQGQYYGTPVAPLLDDARHLFEWAVGSPDAAPGVRELENGPLVLIVGSAPEPRSRGLSDPTP